MLLALVQFNPTVGDITGNKKKILSWIQKARKQGADLVCFPEMSLLGYPPRDLLELPYIMIRANEALLEIAEATAGMAVLVGTVVRNPSSQGKSLFNAAVWCENGQVRQIIHKTLLPAYDVFDENRYFEPGKERPIIDYRGIRWGVSVCEDIWVDPDLHRRKLYALDPVADLMRQDCEVVLNLSASPYSLGKFAVRQKIIRDLTIRTKTTLAYVNQVGGNDELIFDGGSMIMNAEGETLAVGPFFKEGMILLNPKDAKAAPIKVPADMALLEEALVTGLRDYVQKTGFKSVALGLSGGIDSALVAYLAVKALGPKNVIGLLLPSRYSSKGSVTDSKKLAKNLGIKSLTVPINDIHKAYEKEFKKMFKGRKADTTEENVQARIRGNLLMAVSNKLGPLVLSTGNKSELAVGYCTLYGDMSGGLAVIADVPKTMVYELAAHINRRREVIPQNIITKPPSAELRPNQTDQDSLPPYEILDAIIKAYVEELRSLEEIIALGFEGATVRRVITLIQRNEYKRRQAAPGLKVTSKAFGIGRRFPIACKF